MSKFIKDYRFTLLSLVFLVPIGAIAQSKPIATGSPSAVTGGDPQPWGNSISFRVAFSLLISLL